MKHMKKFASVLLALVMVLAMSITTFAAGETGSITIDNAVVGQTYTIYEILKLESYNKDSGAYAYKAADTWSDFINSEGIKDVYVSVDNQGYVTWREGANSAEFAKLAQKYANDNGLRNQGTIEATSTTVTFSNLELGYYLVDSSLGTLCSLDTTNPDVIIKEKNEAPTIDKTVEEDSTGNYGDENDADIGQTVNFKTIVHAKKGAQNYVVHDKMSQGLTLDENSIAVVNATKDSDYTVEFNTTDSCTFEISFTQSYLDKITEDTDIIITYSAVLNENAVISTDANTNDAKLDYGDSNSTEWDQTKTYTYKFELVKTDKDNKVITGAKFELYDAKTGGNKIALVKEENGTYRVATNDEKEAEDFTSAVIEAGQVTIKGLDGDTSYYLEETEAPAGYNKLAERFEVQIQKTNLDATVTSGIWSEGGAHVINQSGSELPSTGGMGTTIFYVLGGILVLGAAVLLITRRRMSIEK